MNALRIIRKSLAGASIAALTIGTAYAADAANMAVTAAAAQGAIDAAPQEAAENGGAEIVVIGSQIRGAKTSGALPVSVVGESQIEAVAAVSGADLFRSIPQLGGVTFNEQVLGGGNANAARGDVSTVSLRGLGQGNTLLLINGRRFRRSHLWL